MIIESGGSNSHSAIVNEEGQLQVLAVTHEADLHANLHRKAYWSVPFKAINPTSTDDYFFYFKNTGTKIYAVPDIRLSPTTIVGVAEVHWVTGTASAVAATTPVNRYLGAAPVLAATEGTAVDITGLSNAGTLAYMNLIVLGTEEKLEIKSAFIVPPGQAFALLWGPATGELSGIVTVVEVELTS